MKFLLRLNAPLQSERLALLMSHWPVIRQQAPDHFVVVSDLKVRVRPLP